jgi:hypothetical protein
VNEHQREPGACKKIRGSHPTHERHHKTKVTMRVGVSMDRLLALVPLSLPLYLCCRLLKDPVRVIGRWVERIFQFANDEPHVVYRKETFQSQLLAYMVMALLGYKATSRLVPNIQQYTLRKGIAGKDLGKRGTATADQPMCVTLRTL